MNPEQFDSKVPLIGSPYDLRVSLGTHVSEPDIRSALESGDCGFVHSFTTGSAVDGPGVRVVGEHLYFREAGLHLTPGERITGMLSDALRIQWLVHCALG